MPGIDESLRSVMEVPGALAVLLVEYTSGLPVESAGTFGDGGPESAAAATTELVRAALDSAAFAVSEAGDTVEDVVVAGRSRYQVLRLVETGFDARLFLYLCLERPEGNLALGRRTLATVAAELALV